MRQSPIPRGGAGRADHRDLLLGRSRGGRRGSDARKYERNLIGREAKIVGQLESDFRAGRDESAEPAAAQLEPAFQDAEVSNGLEVGKRQVSAIASAADAIVSWSTCSTQGCSIADSMGNRRIANVLSKRCPSAGNSRMRGSLPTKLPRDRQMTRASTPRCWRQSISTVSGQPSSSWPSLPARNTTSVCSFTIPTDRGKLAANSPPKYSRRRSYRFQGGVGIDAIMVYNDVLGKPRPGSLQQGLSTTHEFTPDDSNGGNASR